ncbi:MAG: cryptochrome/photolyase family protein [Cellvibrionaceae bacterium]
MNAVWLRNDLRLDDNPAFYFACQDAKEKARPVCVIYCATPEQWHAHNEAGAKIGFRAAALSDLRARLRLSGIALHLIEVARFDDCAEALLKFARSHQIHSLWFNSEVPLDEQRRDQEVKQKLKTENIDTHSFQADFLVSPELLRTKQGGIYKVFTPWYKAWLQQLDDHPPLPVPDVNDNSRPGLTPKSNQLEVSAEPIALPGADTFRSDLWPAHEQTALDRATQFCNEKLHRYLDSRDIPSINGTSTLSPYFASGLISARRCLKIIQDSYRDHNTTSSWRSDPWLREIAWREFYRYLMLNFPKLSRNEPFKPDTEQLHWESNPNLVSAWQKGMTGFPIIDAAMRQLNQTGWMHNRLRMLAASFFTKLMLEHWSKGEAYFMEKLLDGDFASNNGGWQWSASTGCDASPWFRVFNPTRQSEKFDPQGHFIRKFVPELASLDNKSVHNPSLDQRHKVAYPDPIIDYSMARERVLERFRALNELSA